MTHTSHLGWNIQQFLMITQPRVAQIGLNEFLERMNVKEEGEKKEEDKERKEKGHKIG